MQRPPRLPLAIADEVRAPDSPTLEPVGTATEEISIFDDDETELPRKSSMLSSATIEEEDVGNELQPYAVDTGGVNVVPTKIEWKGCIWTLCCLPCYVGLVVEWCSREHP